EVSHLLCIPARAVHLKGVAIADVLFDEAVWREYDHLLPRDLLHESEQPVAILLVEVLEQVRSQHSVEGPRSEVLVELQDIGDDVVVMDSTRLALAEPGFEEVDADGVRDPAWQSFERRAGAAADVKHGVAIGQSLDQLDGEVVAKPLEHHAISSLRRLDP